MDVHTYAFHVDAMKQLVAALKRRDVTFFGQDWGGLIRKGPSLRLFAPASGARPRRPPDT